MRQILFMKVHGVLDGELYNVFVDGNIFGSMALKNRVLRLAPITNPWPIIFFGNPWGHSKLEDAERETWFERARDCVNRYLDVRASVTP